MKIMKKNSLIFLMAGIAFLLPVSCVQEAISPEEEITGREMILDIGVQGMATRAIDTDSDTDLREDFVEVLDVFVSGPFSSSGNSVPAWGVKKYHLTQDSDMVEDGKWKVLNDWRTDGYVHGEDYAVYVAANSKRVKNGNVYTQGIGSLDLTGIASDADLQAALQEAVEYDYDPNEPNTDGGTKPFWGLHNDDKLNPEWLDVHKKYDASAASLSDVRFKRYYTDGKSFLMDGVGEFTPAPTGDVSSVTLYRAAAKVMLDVTFDPDFLSEFGKNPDGQPAWQFVNFAFSTPVFDSSRGWNSDSGEMYDENSIFTAGAIMMGTDADVSGDLKYGNDYGFTLTTYSYPVAWDAESDVDGAPGIIVSVNYKAAGDNSNNIQYYKIPVVEQDVYSLDRNTVYKVSATISAEGGLDLTDAYKVDNCNFDIIPWDWNNAATQAKGLDQDNRLYFAASPTNIILRGDGLRSADINIVKPVGENIGLQYFVMGSATFEEPFKEGSANTTVEYLFNNDIAENQAAPYYFNNVGTRRTRFTKQMAKGDVVYGDVGFIQNKFTRSRGGNKLTVDSYSLPNKGIKYIKVRVYLNVTGWENKKLFRDITIRHYPTSYLTSIGGSWSSRKSAGAFLSRTDVYFREHNDENRGPEEYTTTTQYSFDRRDYNSWDEDSGKGIETGSWPCTWDEYRVLPSSFRDEDVTIAIVSATPAEFVANAALTNPDPGFDRNKEDYDGYFTANSNTAYPDLLTQAQAGSATRYESEAAALSSGGYYYWGENPIVDQVNSREYASQSTTTSSSSNDPNDYDLSNVKDYDYYIKSGHRTDREGNWKYRHYATFTFYKYTHHYKANNYLKPSYTYNKRYYHQGYGPNTAMLVLSGGNWDRRKARWVNVGNEFNEYNKSDIRTNSYGALEGTEPQGKRSFSARGYIATTSGGQTTHSISNVSVQNGGNYQVISSGSSGSNRHMYILRLSETSSQFTLGHPTLDSYNLSQDNVVAPALMIASQLGGFYGDPPTYGYSTSVTSEFYGVRNLFNAQERMWWDARHCATYLEVGTLGVMESSERQRYYYDWRLPTKAELQTIINYQGSFSSNTAILDGFSVEGEDRILEPVLTSKYYRALDGQSVLLDEYNQSGGNDVVTIRCVRELTLEELALLENL